MRRAIPLLPALAFAALVVVPPATAEPGPDAASWDDSHMRSNFARQRGPAPPRPPVQGLSRYEHATAQPVPTPPTGVAETTLEINPHGWKPGGPTGARTASPPWASSRSSIGSARPSTSSGVRRTPTPALDARNMRWTPPGLLPSRTPAGCWFSPGSRVRS